MVDLLGITEDPTYDKPVVSFSQLQSWDRCEYQWHLNYQLGYVPVAKKRALEIGSMGHYALADFYLRRLNGRDYSSEQWIEEELPKITERWLAEADHAEDFTNAALVTWLILRYVSAAEQMDAAHEILAVEEHFMLPMTSPRGREYLMQGYVDLVSQDRQGKLYLWDHKFVGQFWSNIEVLMDSQTPTYAAAMKRQGRPVFGIIINQLKTYDYKDKNKVENEKIIKRDMTYRTDSELVHIEMETGNMVDEMIDRQEFPRRSLKKDCKLCSYQDPCLMSLKGIPVEVVLSETFKKRTPRVPEETTQSPKE